MKRQPSSMRVRTPDAPAAPRRRRASGGRSRSPIERSPAAESTKLAASAAIVAIGPSRPIAAPPAGGPTAVAVQVVASKRPLAASRSSRATSPFRYAPPAARCAIPAAETATATASRCANVSAPSA